MFESREQSRFELYFSYLRKRSFIGFFYRKFWLYPILRSQLLGQVLDVGCGIGDFLASRPASVGVDINPLAVEWCKKRGLNAELMKVNSLPFEDGNFDCIVLDNVLEHLSEPHELLLEINRVLVSGGRLLVGVPGKSGYACDPDHKVFYDEMGLECLMLSLGFDFKKIFYMPLKNKWLAEHIPQYCIYGIFIKP